MNPLKVFWKEFRSSRSTLVPSMGIAFGVGIIAAALDPSLERIRSVLLMLGVSAILISLMKYAADYLRNLDALRAYHTLTKYNAERAEVIIQNLGKTATERATLESALSRLAEENGHDQKVGEPIKYLQSDLQDRLRGEISALEKRANLNLLIGLFISLFGLAALFWFVTQTIIETEPNTPWVQTAIRFAMRFSFVLFLQVFAYFFLRLYRYSLFELKYFHNELTNIQMAILAFEAARESRDKSLLASLAKTMVKTERNFVIKKGEQTVRHESDNAQRDYHRGVLDAMTSIYGRPSGRGDHEHQDDPPPRRRPKAPPKGK